MIKAALSRNWRELLRGGGASLNKFAICACAAAIGLNACSGPGATSSSSGAFLGRTTIFKPASGSGTPISHIVLIVQENRTFNDLFATFPNPNITGTTIGKKKSGRGDVNVSLTPVRLNSTINLNHSYTGFLTAYDSGKMDGFNDVRYQFNHKTENGAPYHYVQPNQVTPYWDMAEQYGLANAMFTTQGSDSFPAHQDLIRGGTKVAYDASLIDNPPYGNNVWGCDSPYGTKTSLITTTLQLEKQEGPFPCTTSFSTYSANYKTLADLLDAKGVSWKYYTPEIGTSGGIWNAFDVIASVRNGSEWGTKVTWPPTNIFTDISNGALPAMSWVIPDGANSDHPGSKLDTGPSWVASVVNAVGQSQYWNSTAIIIVWDDWGGFYDPVAPPLPRDNQGGPGLRVPMIVVSPYVPATSSNNGYISQTFYEFGSIVRFVEDNFGLGRLGTTDGTSNSISDMFNFYQPPRSFSVIPSKYPREYFLRQKPSGIPVDSE